MVDRRCAQTPGHGLPLRLPAESPRASAFFPRRQRSVQLTLRSRETDSQSSIGARTEGLRHLPDRRQAPVVGRCRFHAFPDESRPRSDSTILAWGKAVSVSRFAGSGSRCPNSLDVPSPESPRDSSPTENVARKRIRLPLDGLRLLADSGAPARVTALPVEQCAGLLLRGPQVSTAVSLAR